MKIYYGNEKQRSELSEKHPDVKADWINMSGAEKEVTEMLPVVCIKQKGKERCESGEEYIEELKKIEESE